MDVVKELLKRGYLVEESLAPELAHFEAASLAELLAKLRAPKIISKKFFLTNKSKFALLDKSKTATKPAPSSALEAKEEQEQPEQPEHQTKIKGVAVESYADSKPKKLEVADFSQFFKSRLLALKPFVQERALEGLTSINKIPAIRTRRIISVIGLVCSMRLTKNKNLLFELEGLTGRIAVVVNKSRSELFEKAWDVVLDEVIGVSGVGSREILFANNIVFPDIALREKKNASAERYAAFTSDIHLGSDKFLKHNFVRFVEWLNGKKGSAAQRELSKKVKYLFIIGDTIDGIGVYPGQENELLIHDVHEQYSKLAGLLKKIRKDVTIVLCPGGAHDAVRALEPQPAIPPEVAPELHQLPNVILTTNPARVKIEQSANFEGLDVLLYHGDSYDYYADSVDVLRQSNAKLKPDKIAHFLLRKRHLAPTHGSTNCIPFVPDPLLIKKAPDIFVSGHIHKSAVSSYNDVITISCSCWQSKTAYQEKFGHEPDPCKVPLLNLKTRKVTVLDFS